MSKTTGSGRTQRNNPYQLEELFMTSDAVKLSSCLLRSADVSLAWCPESGSDLRGRMPGW